MLLSLSLYLQCIDIGSQVRVRLQEVSSTQLKQWLGKEPTGRMEKQWGDLENYSGIGQEFLEISYLLIYPLISCDFLIYCYGEVTISQRDGILLKLHIQKKIRSNCIECHYISSYSPRYDCNL